MSASPPCKGGGEGEQRSRRVGKGEREEQREGRREDKGKERERREEGRKGAREGEGKERKIYGGIKMEEMEEGDRLIGKRER